MTEITRCKAGSLWKCTKCEYHVTTQPGREMLGCRCGTPHCKGELAYRGGRFVEEYEVEFKLISDYYLVGVYIRQNRKPLDLAKFHPRNRVSRK